MMDEPKLTPPMEEELSNGKEADHDAQQPDASGDAQP